MKRGAVVGLVLAGVLVVGVGGAVAVSLAGGGADEATAEASMTPTPTAAVASASPDETPDAATAEPTEEPADADPAPTPGAYVEYSEAALAAAEGERVLFFHASWCPQCHALEDDIEAQGVPDGVTILKVDYDSNQDLRQRYGVVQQTTVVALDDSGEADAVFNPYDDPTVGSALAGLGLGG